MVIVIKAILSVVGDVQIFPAIIIVITGADSLAPSRRNQTGFFGDIRKSAVMIVVIKMVGGSLTRWKSFQRGSVHDENIRPSVIVIIKDGYARPCCPNDVLFGVHTAKYVHRGQSRFFR